MDKVYVVTGVSGHVGNTIVRKLLNRGAEVTGLRYPGEPDYFPQIRTITGDLLKKETLIPLFQTEKKIIVIHSAGYVSVRSDEEARLWNVNVVGTRNMIELSLQYHVEKFIYISSVHAIPEKEELITEVTSFDAGQVTGAYAKSKAVATQSVLDAVGVGLPACVVHPSGIIGPYDYKNGQTTSTLKAFMQGKLLMGLMGGYDFVDVRDVANGVLACAKKGKVGECYILSGHFYTIKELLDQMGMITGRKPPKIYLKGCDLRWVAGLVEKCSKLFRRSTIFTPYTLYTLDSCAHFSCEKAKRELGYHSRPMEVTLRDTVKWIRIEIFHLK